MIITISGVPGSGKSTVAKIVSKKIGYRHFSIGDLMRELARKKGLTLLEISRLAETDRAVDVYLDKRQRELGREKDIVVDSRLGFHFIPESFKVFLDVSPEEAGRRIFEARRGVEAENVSLEKTVENAKRRKESERLRYRKFYNVSPFDPKHYDLVIDTTEMGPGKVAAAIIRAVRQDSGRRVPEHF